MAEPGDFAPILTKRLPARATPVYDALDHGPHGAEKR